MDVVLLFDRVDVPYCTLLALYHLQTSMQVWGLNREDTWYMVTLLCVLRLPGIALLDIWWMDHSATSIPLSLELADIADSGVNLLLLVMVSTHHVLDQHLM